MKFTSIGLSDELLEASKTLLKQGKDYEDFFQSALKKFKVDSPADFKTDDKKKEFFDYIDKNYEATDESVKEDVRDMKNYKDKIFKLNYN